MAPVSKDRRISEDDLSERVDVWVIAAPWVARF